MLAAINLAVTALVFVGFGIWPLVDPKGAAEGLGLAFQTSDGPVSLRAMYGGYLIGAGLLFAYFASRPDQRRLGLIAILLIVGPILATRLFGMWSAGSASPPQLGRAGLEAGSLIVTGGLLFLRG